MPRGYFTGDPPTVADTYLIRTSSERVRLPAVVVADPDGDWPAPGGWVSRRLRSVTVVVANVTAGLRTFSVSRGSERARGWGIPVPGDPGQVIYVWWDALGNYLTALDYASGGENLRRWWDGASRRIHLLGKGVLRFHAVYWPAILLSAGEAVPTDIAVHGYLTSSGRKISKSSGATADPYDLVARYGTDAVRWWLLREVPAGGDADFTVGRLAARADDELANGFGNLVNRVVSLIYRYRAGRAPVAPASAPGAAGPEAAALGAAVRDAPGLVDAALADFDFRRATEAVWAIADEANRYVNRARPWDLAKVGDDAAVDAVLAALLRACQAIGVLLTPFLPDAAAHVTRQCAPAGRGSCRPRFLSCRELPRGLKIAQAYSRKLPRAGKDDSSRSRGEHFSAAHFGTVASAIHLGGKMDAKMVARIAARWRRPPTQGGSP